MRKSKIVGTGLYAPERLVPNQYFNDLYKIDVDKFLREKRNIFQRHYMNADQASSDLIVPAAQEALKNAGITADDIDLLIVATDTPDYISPSTASVVQHKLKATNAGTFDVNTACSGFVTSLDIANKFIVADERYKNILVTGVYGMSKYLDWDDYKISSLMGDGAGAVVLRATHAKDHGILASQMFTDGQYHDHMGIFGGGTYRPMTKELIDAKGHLLSFAKRIPPEVNSIHWPRLAKIMLDRTGRKVEDVNHFFLTQININSITETLDALGVPHSKSHNIMDRFGYTGSGCIPMAMADAVRSHKLKKGDFVILIGSGGGMSMAAMALEWGYDT